MKTVIDVKRIIWGPPYNHKLEKFHEGNSRFNFRLYQDIFMISRQKYMISRACIYDIKSFMIRYQGILYDIEVIYDIKT